MFIILILLSTVFLELYAEDGSNDLEQLKQQSCMGLQPLA
jgi:hypothetical protein